MTSLVQHRCRTRQGNVVLWLARPGTLSEGETLGTYQCRSGIYSQAGEELVSPKAITAKHQHEGSEYFLVLFDGEETAGLPEGEHEIAVEIWNDAVTPPYRQETPVMLTVEAQRIPAS